ncbi:senescence-associated carboxylesterase 101-like [Trifolium medium]|uniref:Senescence-associated carboxylesterase 101-like n=1 Tax=Trifolium medium TaxID=97028 RepID=A0A392N6V8_9FABA|nr:senescence-associated carboxylesterase 101-like [Trifolium medium]
MTNTDSLATGISLQLRALGLIPQMQQQQKNIDINTLETKLKELEKRFIQKTTLFDPSKKLNAMKRSMAQLECLTSYWKKMVEEAEMKPQSEGAAFRASWLYGGTTYRRMFEPLAIAQYYREGG